jgi:hypothetical protein
MKKILTILFASLIGWTVIHSAYAFIMSGMPIDAGSEGQWVYTNTTDSYNDSKQESPGVAICADITFPSGGDVTAIGVKFPGVETDDFKVSLGTAANPTVLLLDCGEQTASTTAGWNDITCSTSYTVTASTYRLCYDLSGYAIVYHNNSSTGYWGTQAYATFPAASQGLASASNELHALRAKLE